MKYRVLLLVALATNLGLQASEASDETKAPVDAIQKLVGDPAVGEKQYRRECRGCHGPTAKGLASYPGLVQHPPDYIVDRLARYRSGEKIGPNTPLMAPRAKKLSDGDIADLTAFIDSLKES